LLLPLVGGVAVTIVVLSYSIIWPGCWLLLCVLDEDNDGNSCKSERKESSSFWAFFFVDLTHLLSQLLSSHQLATRSRGTDQKGSHKSSVSRLPTGIQARRFPLVGLFVLLFISIHLFTSSVLIDFLIRSILCWIFYHIAYYRLRWWKVSP
jgi:hypothetical protein